MTLLAVIILIVIATVFTSLKWIHVSRTLYLIALLIFLAVGCGPVPIWLLIQLQSVYVEKPTMHWDKCNAIVMLGAGTEKIAHTNTIEPTIISYSRLLETISLYRECQKTGTNCKIIISGGDAEHNGIPEANVYASKLNLLGIAQADILLESKSMNTWQNAQFTNELIKKYKIEYVTLVSSGIHLRRSVLYFNHFGINTVPVRSDYLQSMLSLVPLSYNFMAADFALHEYTGIARYYLYNILGLNPERKNPGDA